MTRRRPTRAQRRFIEAVAQREKLICEETTRGRFSSYIVDASVRAGWVECVSVWMLTPEGRAALKEGRRGKKRYGLATPMTPHRVRLVDECYCNSRRHSVTEHPVPGCLVVKCDCRKLPPLDWDIYDP